MAVAYIWPQWSTPLEAALHYAGLGWKVFPCYLHTNPKSGRVEKKPYVEWVEAATIDAGQITRWWTKWPEALIGHCPGASGHVVIDVDVKNGGRGEEQWGELNGSRSIRTMNSMTLHDGHHLWFKKGSFERINYFHLASNVEVRADTVYVILPSSDGKYIWVGAREAMPMPDWLVARIKQNEEGAGDRRGVDTEVEYEPAKKKFLERLRKSKMTDRMWLRVHVLEKREIAKDNEEDRSGVMHRMECLLRDLGMSEGECFALVWRSGWCKFRFDRRSDKGEEQLAREIAKVYDSGETSPPSDDDDGPLEPRWLIDVAPQPNNFLYYPYFPEGEAVVFAGPGGVGKGVTVADWVARLTSARRWPMSKEKGRVGNVLWMEEEDSEGKTVRVRLESMGADLAKIIIATADEFRKVDRTFIERYDIRMIVLSPLLSAMDLDSSINEMAVRREWAKLRELYRDLPTTLIGLMHPNKKHDQVAVDRISGSRAFTTFPRSTLVINHEKPKKQEETKQEDDEKEDTAENLFRLTHQNHRLSVRGHDLIGKIVNLRKDLERSQYLGIEWSQAEENIDIDEALARKREPKEDEGPSAGEWLQQFLITQGATLRSAIMEEAAKRGYTESAVVKARKRNPKIKIELKGPPEAKVSIWTYVK
jgi:hypothetical protein